MKFKFAKDVKESTERKESRSFAFLLFLISIMCCAWIAPSYLFADLAVTIPGGTIPPELWEKNQPTKKPPLPSQMYGLSPDPAKILHLPPIDVDALKEKARAASKGGPLLAGTHREVNASPLTHGEWWEIGKGSMWLFEIHAPGGTGIVAHITDVDLPRGARIYVYSPSSPDAYAGPYKGGPEIWAGPVSGDKIVIEVDIPVPYDYSKASFKVEGVSHSYGRTKQKTTLENVAPLVANCHNDATCSPDWATEGDAVGRLYYMKDGLPWLCTGTMIDDLTGDRTPYFLTANHCIPDDSSTVSGIKVYGLYENTAQQHIPLPWIRN